MTSQSPLGGPGVLPANGADPTSLVILLHGYGSNGADLIALAPYFQAAAPGAAFIAPNAPQECPGAPQGYQWWGIRSMMQAERVSGAEAVAPILDDFIDGMLANFGLSEDRLVLVGFSQGTMMALHVGPRRGRQLAGIIGFSGMLVDENDLATGLRTRPPVLLIHGEEDPVIPVGAFHEAEAALGRMGFEVTGHVSPGLGHSIDPAGLKLATDFIRRVLG